MLEHLDTFVGALAAADRSKRTLEQYRSKVSQFERWRAAQDGQDYTVALLAAYRDVLREGSPGRAAVSGKTIRVTFSALWAWLEWLKAASRVEAIPERGCVRLPRMEAPDTRTITHEEMRRIWEAALALPTHRPRLRFEAARTQAVLASLALTGLRRAELLALEVGDVTLGEDAGELRVRRGKGGQTRRVPLNGDARAYLERWIQVRGEWAQGRADVSPALWLVDRSRAMGSRALDGMLEDILARAGLTGSGITPHCFRRYLATTLDETPGVSIATIGAILGHSKPQTTYEYLKSTREGMKKALESVSLTRRSERGSVRLSNGKGGMPVGPGRTRFAAGCGVRGRGGR